MNAAGGASRALIGARLLFARNELPPKAESAAAGASDRVSVGEPLVGLGSVSADAAVGAISEATRALLVDEEDAAVEDSFVEDAFALEVEPGAAEDGVDADEDTPRPSAAKADGDNNAKSMAATATLTSSPPDVS